jgi:hypothetical protein
MSAINQLIYTIESLEMSGDNAHLPHFRSDLRKVAAALKAGQAMRSEVKYYYNDNTSGTRAWDDATKEDV